MNAQGKTLTEKMRLITEAYSAGVERLTRSKYAMYRDLESTTNKVASLSLAYTKEMQRLKDSESAVKVTNEQLEELTGGDYSELEVVFCSPNSENTVSLTWDDFLTYAE